MRLHLECNVALQFDLNRDHLGLRASKSLKLWKILEPKSKETFQSYFYFLCSETMTKVVPGKQVSYCSEPNPDPNLIRSDLSAGTSLKFELSH